MVCKNCGFAFPTKTVDTDILISKGEKSREGSNTLKILERMRRDIVKLYGAGIHACLLFTTVDNPSRQSSGFKAYSPLRKYLLCQLQQNTAGQSSLENPSLQKSSISDTLFTGEPTAPHKTKTTQIPPTPSQASVPLSTVPPHKPIQTLPTPSQASVPLSTEPPHKPIQTPPTLSQAPIPLFKVPPHKPIQIPPTPSQAPIPLSTVPPHKPIQTPPTLSQASVPLSKVPPHKPIQIPPTPSQAPIPLSTVPPHKPFQTPPTPSQASVPHSTVPSHKPIQTPPTPSQASVPLSTVPSHKPIQTPPTPSQASIPLSTVPPHKPIQIPPTPSQASVSQSMTPIIQAPPAPSQAPVQSRPKRSCPSIFRKGLETEKEPKTERKMKSREIKKTKLSSKPEKIMNEKSESGKSFYLVKWIGYPEEDNTWEPEENFDPALIQEYKDNKMN
ncbi:uncharacterized protein LOC133179726 [Saccostrea echinata]|uniref:uncharacterized protein LOC133179726 n=1 Tax=Saccostrea echinata TaxID=191078 RepID=UPI002A7FA90A|nr:uncharacterized protein LOC133179726 [Saccostrea echinata]